MKLGPRKPPIKVTYRKRPLLVTIVRVHWCGGRIIRTAGSQWKCVGCGRVGYDH